MFLTKMIREKRRMAFVRSVLYDALICPPCGEYFKDSRLISLESERLRSIELSRYNDVIVCRPGSGPKKYRPRMIWMTRAMKPAFPAVPKRLPRALPENCLPKT